MHEAPEDQPEGKADLASIGLLAYFLVLILIVAGLLLAPVLF